VKIWVDADACPVVIKEILFRASERTGIRITLVANHPIRIPPLKTITFMQVPPGFDVADNEIVKRIEAGDLVITSDIPLAAEAIEKGSVELSQDKGILEKKRLIEAWTNKWRCDLASSHLCKNYDLSGEDQAIGKPINYFMSQEDAVSLIKAIRIKDRESLYSIEECPADAILLDTYRSNVYGGTGKGFDRALAILAKEYGRRLIIAGGLNPDNVYDVIKEIRPYGVDVSSGIESSPGYWGTGNVFTYDFDTSSQYNTYRAVIQNGTARLYVNDKIAFDIPAHSGKYNINGVEFGAGSSGATGEAYFDEIRAYQVLPDNQGPVGVVGTSFGSASCGSKASHSLASVRFSHSHSQCAPPGRLCISHADPVCFAANYYGGP